MHKSRILTGGGILVLSCDRDGCLTWTPRIQKLAAAIQEMDLAADHPIRVALADMERESLLALVLPHKDELRRLETISV